MTDINRDDLHAIVDLLPADDLGKAIDVLSNMLTGSLARDPSGSCASQLRAAPFGFRPSSEHQIQLLEYGLRGPTPLREDAVRAAEHWGSPCLAPLLRAHSDVEPIAWLAQDARRVAAEIERAQSRVGA